MRAIPCPCGHPACKHWHVSGVANVQGVSFTEAQAKAIVVLLRQPEVVAQFAATHDEAEKASRAHSTDGTL